MILNLTTFNKNNKSMKDCDRTSFLGLHNIVRLFSVVGFFALTMSAINAEDSQCCGAENVNDLSDIKVREIPNVKRSSKSNHYGPYELDYSNEDPAHAIRPFEQLEDKDKIFDFKHQKGKVLIKVQANWANPRDFWKQLDFPGIDSMEQVFPGAKGNRKIEKMAAVLPEGGHRKPDLWRWVEASLSPDTTVMDVVKGLRGRPEIEFIEPVYIYSSNGPVPSGDEGVHRIQELPSKEANTDPEWKGDSLYHIDALNVPKAWKYLESRQATTKTPGGSPDVIIAILDTGVDYNHEDLKPNMWVNGGEIAGNNIDDDKNGFIDDVNGVSVVSNKEAHSGDPMDFNGHGTHCAGIAAAAGKNDKGIVGVAYGCRIMAIKAGQYAGIFSTTDIAEGVYYAIENGADIINMSLGGPDSEVVRDALSVAFGDIVLIAAAGNSGKANEYPCSRPSPSYPAAHNWVLGVEARKKYWDNGWRAPFSNYDCVPYTKYEYEVMAPGAAIYSTWPGEGSYASLDGTSMAAPTIAGMAGLLRTQWPKSQFSSRFIMGQITGSSGKLGSEGNRVPDALSALTEVPTPKLFMKEFWLFDTEDIDAENDNDGVVDAGETVDVALVIRNQWGKATDVKVKIEPLAKIEEGGSKLEDQKAYQADPYIEMITEQVSYDPLGSFNRGDNKLVYDSGGAIIGVKFPFKFKVNKNTPNDHFIPFLVTLSARNGYDPEDLIVYETQQRFQIQVQSGSEIPTIVSSDLTLTKDKFWIAIKPILIEKGATVTVEPGTQIQLGGPDPKTVYRDPFGRAFIQVEGKLETKGTADELVSIFPAPFWMPDPKYGGKSQNAVIRVRENGVFNMDYTSVMNPEVKGDRFDHVRFRYDIKNAHPFYIRATELAYTECDLIVPEVVDMDTCLVTRVGLKGSYYTRGDPALRPGGLWINESDSRDPNKESRYGSGMRNSVVLGHMVDMDTRYAPTIQTYEDMPNELIKNNTFIEPKVYDGKTYVTVYPRTWLSKPGELTSVRGWNSTMEGKDGFEAIYSKSAMKTASLVAGYFGGDVLQINDINENTFIANYIKDTLTNYTGNSITEAIISFNDTDDDGKFTWYNQGDSSFTNWGSGFPENIDGAFFTKINGAGTWTNAKWIKTQDGRSYDYNLRKYIESSTLSADRQQSTYHPSFRKNNIGWYGTNIRQVNYYFPGELPVILELPGEKSQQYLDDNHDKMFAALDSQNHAVRNNALLSSTWDPNTKNLMSVKREKDFYGIDNYYHSGQSERDINLTDNYWGPIADKRVDAMITDGVDYGHGQKILYKPRLDPAVDEDYLSMEEIWPFVVDIKITSADVKRTSLANVPDIGMGVAIFEIIFNRDMDTTLPLRANFGPDAPFTDYPIRPYGENNGWANDSRTWLGTFEITPVTGDGYQMVRTYKAVAKSDPWLESGRDTGRFRFTINTVTIESLNLQVNSAEGANKLIWVQKDFNMLAGFNLYKSTTKNGTYKKINRALIPKNKRSYVDTGVAPGSKYFYKYKVVDTQGTESAFSNLDDATPIMVVLPTIKHDRITTGEVQKDITLIAEVTDNVDIKDVSVYYRLIGAKTYNKVVATKISGNMPGFLKFQATVPGAEVFAPGVEYYIEVFDGVSTNSHATPDTPNKVILENTLYLSYLEPSSGSLEGGDKITVTGTNFEAGMDIYFGTKKATDIVINSATELTCSSPKHFPTYVDVRIENQSRQMSRLVNGFSYTSPKVNLVISDRKVALGRNVVVPLDVGAFSGMASMDSIVFYNANDLTPVKVTTGDLLSKWSFSSNIEEKGKIKISAASPSGTVSGTGNLVNIEFKAIGEPGKVSPVTLGATSLNEGSIEFNSINGSVSIDSSEDSKATINVTNLKHVYDGSPKSASVSISVTVDQTIVTYKGKSSDDTVYEESTTPPTNAGLYTVKVKVHDKQYTGEKEAFLEIEKAPVTISLTDLSHIKDGNAKQPQVSISVAGLNLKTEYRDSGDNKLAGSPSEEGTYRVKVELDENNYQGSAFADLTIKRIVGAITLDNLTQTYDGGYKPVRLVTIPDGAAVAVKYDGSDEVPINAGSYYVTAVFTNPKYKGSATGTLVIKKREVKISVTNVVQDYSGQPKQVSVTTVPPGLSYNVTYDGGSTAPSDYGTYSVKVVINDLNSKAELNKTLTIKKPDAEIRLFRLAKIYDGNESPVGITIVPAGLNHEITYNGSSDAPTEPGKYSVEAVIDDSTYQGRASGELVITKAIATINIGNLTQEYDGEAKLISVTTSPAGLTSIIKYNGTDLQPVSAGKYDVTVALNDSRYQGSWSGTLTIEKAEASIEFANLINIVDGTPKAGVITSTPSGLNLVIKYLNSEGETLGSAPSAVGVYQVEATVSENNYFGGLTKTLKINAKDPFGSPVTYPQISAQLLGSVDIFGVPASDGDVIAAFVGSELRGKQQIVVNNGVAYATVTISVLEEGEKMTLKLWRRDKDVLVDYEEEFLISPAQKIGEYPDNLYVLSFGGFVEQTLNLNKGWNLISFAIIADDMNPAKLFESIKSSLLIIKDTTSIYNPNIPEFLNTLKKTRLDKGYWVKMKEDKFLTIQGSRPKEVTVNLRSGWNLIGYPVSKAEAPSEVIKSIVNDVETVKSTFSMYDPSLPSFLNTLKQMEAGKGYWVKMKNEADLKFGNDDSGLRTIKKMAANEAPVGGLSQIIVYPNIPSTLIGSPSIEGIIQEEGDFIAAFVDNELRGAQNIVFNEDKSYVTLNVNMKGNESLKLHYWDSSEARGYAMSGEVNASIGETYGSRSDLLKFHFSPESLDGLLFPYVKKTIDNEAHKFHTVKSDSEVEATTVKEQPIITINLLEGSLYIRSKANDKKKVYVLESSSNLDNWMPVKIYKGGSSIEFKLDDPVSELRGYYRVKVKSE